MGLRKGSGEVGNSKRTYGTVTSSQPSGAHCEMNCFSPECYHDLSIQAAHTTPQVEAHPHFSYRDHLPDEWKV